MGPIEKTQISLRAQGHTNIQATHSSTFEVTMDSHLSVSGDCIVGVNASHSAQHINRLIGATLKRVDSQVLTYLSVGEITEKIQGFGAPQLLLTSPTSLVWRTSDFIDERTIAIRCNKAAKDLNRQLIALLQQPETVLQVTLVVVPGVT
jgi:hypothetical protein